MSCLGPNDLVQIVSDEIFVVTVSFGKIKQTWLNLKPFGIEHIVQLIDRLHCVLAFGYTTFSCWNAYAVESCFFLLAATC